MKTIIKIYFLTIFLLFHFSCTPVRKSNVSIQQTFFAFDTIITITIVDNKLDNKQFNKIIEGLKKASEKYDLLFNIYNKKSEVYRIRSFKKDRFYSINQEVYEVLKKCKEYYYLTDGAFDVTVGKITQLYDFNNNKIPTEDEIKKNLKFIGMKNIVLSNEKVKLLKENINIDLGGIAKGYIIDKFSELIKRKGYKNFLVNIGGDVYASGKNKYRKNWVIGVQNPKKSGGIVKTIEISDKAIVTSGSYERYVLIKKKKYHHIINPATGYPVWNNIVSVTVISDKTVEADYIATAMFVLGVERSKDFIEKNYKDKVKYYIIVEEKEKFIIISNNDREEISL